LTANPARGPRSPPGLLSEIAAALVGLCAEGDPTVVAGVQSRGSLLGPLAWIGTGAEATAVRELVGDGEADWVGVAAVVDDLQGGHSSPAPRSRAPVTQSAPLATNPARSSSSCARGSTIPSPLASSGRKQMRARIPYMAPLPGLPRVYVDFNGLVAAQPFRVVLDTRRTRDDLERQGLRFEEGPRVLFYDLDATEHRDPDNLHGVGVISWDERWGWVGVIEGELLNESEWDALPQADCPFEATSGSEDPGWG
jgi:hypothetical protein